MADYHCDECGADASYDPKFSGCGDSRCCTPIWDLVCGCDGACLCSCDEAEEHKSDVGRINEGKGNG